MRNTTWQTFPTGDLALPLWSIINGTVVNVFTVMVGSLAGIMLSSRLPDRYRTIVLNALGLVTISLGIDACVIKFSETVSHFAPLSDSPRTYGARLAMVMIGSLIIGSIIGTALRLHERIESIGGWIHQRFSGQDAHRFAEGFLTASVIFCVGPLTLLGCLRNGADGNPDYLYIKSLLDGFCSIALASSLGWGVFASAGVVLGFQGGLSFLAVVVAEPLDEISLALMTMVGGLVMLATALLILDIKRMPIANFLPGIFLPPLIVYTCGIISPGWLLPLSP